jgi:hypothetical protein
MGFEEAWLELEFKRDRTPSIELAGPGQLACPSLQLKRVTHHSPRLHLWCEI